jgi:hypothetical protein
MSAGADVAVVGSAGDDVQGVRGAEGDGGYATFRLAGHRARSGVLGDCESCVRSSEDTVQVRIKLLLVLQLQVEVERNPRNQTTNDQPSIASIIP